VQQLNQGARSGGWCTQPSAVIAPELAFPASGRVLSTRASDLRGRMVNVKFDYSRVPGSR